MESLFDATGIDTWASIRKIYRQEVANAISTFTTALSGFELVGAQSETMISNLKDYARSIIEKKSREEAGKVLMHMKDRYFFIYLQISFVYIIHTNNQSNSIYRFSTVFNHDEDSMPRVWTGKENVRIITKEARATVPQNFRLKLLDLCTNINLKFE